MNFCGLSSLKTTKVNQPIVCYKNPFNFYLLVDESALILYEQTNTVSQCTTSYVTSRYSNADYFNDKTWLVQLI